MPVRRWVRWGRCGRGRTCRARPGHGGNGSIAVCFLTEPLAITSAMTNATTSSTAEPAANHNQRGVLGPCGGGESARREIRPVGAGRIASTAAAVGSDWPRGGLGATGEALAGALLETTAGNVTAVRGCIRRLVGVSRVGGRRIGEPAVRSARTRIEGTKPLGATWIVHVHLMACRVPALGAGALMYPATSQPGEL